jgi:hypothetical protein
MYSTINQIVNKINSGAPQPAAGLRSPGGLPLAAVFEGNIPSKQTDLENVVDQR